MIYLIKNPLIEGNCRLGNNFVKTTEIPCTIHSPLVRLGLVR